MIRPVYIVIKPQVAFVVDDLNRFFAPFCKIYFYRKVFYYEKTRN